MELTIEDWKATLKEANTLHSFSLMKAAIHKSTANLAREMISEFPPKNQKKLNRKSDEVQGDMLNATGP